VGKAEPKTAADCFHCGLPIPSGTSFRFEAPEGTRAFCCAGCEAVSVSISGLGLDGYYRLRSEHPGRPEPSGRNLSVFDQPALRDRFVVDRGQGEMEALLVVEDLRCAACAWLVEEALARVPGVRLAQVQYATRRARVRWDRTAARPSTILAAIERLGYAAWPFDEERLALVEAGERRALLRRRRP
jgi:P-type Cu2+ transporter